MLRPLLAGLLVALLAAPAVAQNASVQSIDVEGTEIDVKLGDGKTLRSKELVGAVLDVRFEGEPVKLRIAQVENDPQDTTGTVWLHTMEGRQPDGVWRNVCSPGPDQREQGFPLMVNGKLEFTCTAGALGKCVRFGYRPWANGPDGKPMAPQHSACVRLVRGDYGGTSEPWTKNGMLIDVYDPLDIQTPSPETEQIGRAHV